MGEARPNRNPPYKDLMLVSGVLLVVLGIGNWTVGSLQMAPHEDYLAQHPGPRVTVENLKTELLRPPDPEREERDVSRAKLDFYQVVQSGGRLMVVLGTLCLLAWFVNVRATRPILWRAAGSV